MFLHFQETDRQQERWSIACASVKDDVIDKATHLSVFAVSAVPAPGEDDAFRWEDQTYEPVFGFPFDIDHSDIGESIREVNKLLDVLVQMDVDLAYVQVYASGSKGFHVLVPAKYYSTGRAVKYLPQIYRRMAAMIRERQGITGLDLNLYHGKRGSLLRVPNRLRADGKYKVPLTLAQVRSITPESYAVYAAAPREVPVQDLPKGARATGMVVLFESSKDDIAKQLRQGNKTQAVPEEVLAKFGDQQTPKCVEWITAGANCKSESFNSFAMQLEIYLAKAPVSPHKADDLREQLVLHGKSDRLKSQKDRRDHLRQVRSSVDKDAYTFSCGAMRKLLDGDPCVGCPVMQAEHDAIEERTGIQVLPQGYFLRGPKGSLHQITNFHLKPIACYLVDGPFGRFIEAHDFHAVRDGQRLTRVTIHRSQWDSIDAFKAALNVIPNGVIKGTSDLVMDLKSFLTETSEMESILHVNEAGIHRHIEYQGGDLARDGEVLFDTQVWVEPGWSINAIGIRGTHVLHHKGPQNVAQLRTVEPATPDDVKFIEVFRKVITVNRPEIIGTTLGWVVACNLKHHIMTSGNEFPLLHLFGPSGVGKTKTAQIFSALAGADYHTAPTSAGSTSPFPLKDAVSMTTTVPKIIDECTPSKFSRQGHWYLVRDLLKAAYQGSSVSTGTLRAGGNKLDKTSAYSIPYRATAPIIFTATDGTDDVELVTRSIILQLDEKQKTEGTRQQDFEWLLMNGWQPLFRLARVLILDALKVSLDEARSRLTDCLDRIPAKMDGRMRKNLAVVLLGLHNLKTTLVNRGFPSDLVDLVVRIEEQTLTWWQEHAARAMRKVRLSEVDQTYQTLSDMAVATLDRVNNYLVAGTDYLLQNDMLYINSHAWTPYLQFLRTIAGQPHFSSFAKFRELVEKEPYFISFDVLPGIASTEKWLAVDYYKLRERTDVSGFKQTRK